MKRAKILTLVASLSLQTACAGSIAGDVVRPSPEMAEPCTEPARLPVRALTQAEVEIYWGRDRTALRNCAEMHNAVVALIDAQADAQLNRRR